MDYDFSTYHVLRDDILNNKKGVLSRRAFRYSGQPSLRDNYADLFKTKAKRLTGNRTYTNTIYISKSPLLLIKLSPASIKRFTPEECVFLLKNLKPKHSDLVKLCGTKKVNERFSILEERAKKIKSETLVDYLDRELSILNRQIEDEFSVHDIDLFNLDHKLFRRYYIGSWRAAKNTNQLSHFKLWYALTSSKEEVTSLKDGYDFISKCWFGMYMKKAPSLKRVRNIISETNFINVRNGKIELAKCKDVIQELREKSGEKLNYYRCVNVKGFSSCVGISELYVQAHRAKYIATKEGKITSTQRIHKTALKRLLGYHPRRSVEFIDKIFLPSTNTFTNFDINKKNGYSVEVANRALNSYLKSVIKNKFTVLEDYIQKGNLNPLASIFKTESKINFKTKEIIGSVTKCKKLKEVIMQTSYIEYFRSKIQESDFDKLKEETEKMEEHWLPVFQEYYAKQAA